MNTEAKILNKLLAVKIQQYTKKKYLPCRDVRLVQYLKIKQCNPPRYKVKKENHVITTTYVENYKVVYLTKFNTCS